MSKPRNPVRSEKFPITTTGQVVAYLDAIAATGLYGKNRVEVADRLIARGIEELVKSGLVKRLDSRR